MASVEGKKGGRRGTSVIQLRASIIAVLFLGACALGDVLQEANDLYAQGKYAPAARMYHRALEEGANPALAYFNLANACYQMDSLTSAIVYYQAALQEAPRFFRGHLNLGILYYTLEDYPAAIAALTRARSLEPQNTQVMLIMALCYRNLGERSYAVPLLETVLARDSTVDDCYFILADINQEIGDIPQALDILRRYPESGPRAADKHQTLGELYEQRDNCEKATYHYRQVVSAAPQRKWAFYKLVLTTEKCGGALLALETAAKALQRFDTFPQLALLAGNVAFENAYYREAGALYLEAYRQGEADGLVGLENVIKHYESAHNEARAQELRRRILAQK